MPDATTVDLILSRLAIHLGPNVAKMAMKSFAKKAGVAYEQLTSAHVPALVDEIRPMLNVMIGKGAAEAVLADIGRVSALR